MHPWKPVQLHQAPPNRQVLAVQPKGPKKIDTNHCIDWRAGQDKKRLRMDHELHEGPDKMLPLAGGAA